jgi:hypothetical protein
MPHILHVISHRFGVLKAAAVKQTRRLQPEVHHVSNGVAIVGPPGVSCFWVQ